MAHTCHWPECNTEVPPSLWGCKTHWLMLPKALRREIWRTYKPGQEITKTPSVEYIAVAKKVQDWIKTQMSETEVYTPIPHANPSET